MFERLGHFGFRHRRALILTWIVVIVLSAFAAIRVTGKLAHGVAAPTYGEANEGSRILQQELDIKANSLVVVFSSSTLRADDLLVQDEMDASLSGLRELSLLDPPITYRNTNDPGLISRDGYTTYAIVGVNGDAYDACKIVPEVRERLQPQSDLTVVVTGDPAFRNDAEAVATADMGRAEKYTFAVVAVVLVLVFGSLVAAGLPLAIGAASVVLTMGVTLLLTQFVDITMSSVTIIAFLGLGCGVDYSLIMVTRFREELSTGKGVEESLVITCTTSGKAIFYSAATACIGLAALITFDNPVLHSLGIGGIAVIAIALAAGLTLLPALLAVLGPRVNRLSLFHLTQREGTFWQRLARWEMRHPVVVLVVLLPLIGLLVWPLARANPSNYSYTQLPAYAPARQGYEMLRQGFGAGEAAPIMICVTADSKITDWANVIRLYDLTRRIAASSNVSRVDSIVNLDPSITREQYEFLYALPASARDPRVDMALGRLASEHATLVRVVTSSDPMGPEARQLVASIRDIDIGGLKTYVTGPAASDEDMVRELYHGFLWALVFILAISYIALFSLFRSVLLPLKAILLNVVSVAATFGILVFIFQEGHFRGVLSFETDGTVNLVAAVIVFCIVSGLSMDYEVFLLTRVKEVWDETSDNTGAVAVGLQRTGRVITSAALVMVVVFGTFAISDLVYLKITGLGLAISILLDATIIRLFLAPALMRILGKWNWWAPASLKRLGMRLPVRRWRHGRQVVTLPDPIAPIASNQGEGIDTV